MTDARSYQEVAEALLAPTAPDARVYQSATEVLVQSANEAHIYQSVTEVLIPNVREVHVYQAVVEILLSDSVVGIGTERIGRRMGVWQPDVPCLTL